MLTRMGIIPPRSHALSGALFGLHQTLD